MPPSHPGNGTAGAARKGQASAKRRCDAPLTDSTMPCRIKGDDERSSTGVLNDGTKRPRDKLSQGRLLLHILFLFAQNTVDYIGVQLPPCPVHASSALGRGTEKTPLLNGNGIMLLVLGRDERNLHGGGKGKLLLVHHLYADQGPARSEGYTYAPGCNSFHCEFQRSTWSVFLRPGHPRRVGPLGAS